MKEQLETSVPRRNIVPLDSDEARKTATGHSCNPLVASVKDDTTTSNRRLKTKKK